MPQCLSKILQQNVFLSILNHIKCTQQLLCTLRVHNLWFLNCFLKHFKVTKGHTCWYIIAHSELDEITFCHFNQYFLLILYLHRHVSLITLIIFTIFGVLCGKYSLFPGNLPNAVEESWRQHRRFEASH